MSIAERLYAGWHAESEISEALDDLGVRFERIGWDEYDNSFELHGAAPDYRCDEQVQRYLFGAGFSKVYVNHTDKWETHYTFDQLKPFALSEGWRVSYGHKRGKDEKQIWVEEVVPTWPAEWFDTGYVVVKSTVPERGAGTP